MSDQSEHGAALTARVIEVEAADAAAPPRPLAPQIIPTERTEPITPSEPALPAVAPVDSGHQIAPLRRLAIQVLEEQVVFVSAAYFAVDSGTISVCCIHVSGARKRNHR